MARDLGVTVKDLVRDPALRARIDKQKYVTDTVGLPTLNDILAELAKPGRDPREQFEVFQFAEGVSKIEDVKAGMKLPGIVTNVTAFGAFVDVGVHQDGLVHVSQLADRFVKDPNEVVKVSQRVEVTVLEVDLARKRIALSLRKNPSVTGRRVEVKPEGAGVSSPAQSTTSAPRPPGPRPQAPARASRPQPPAKPSGPPAGGWFSDALKQAKKG
jgi:uncharacterized protein